MRLLRWYGDAYVYHTPEYKRMQEEADAEDQPGWEEFARGTRGLVLGRFLPPHAGHQYLIYFALQRCQKVTVVLHASFDDPIPAELRLDWLKELFPATQVMLERDLTPDAWKAQIQEWSGEPYEYLFSSEPEHAAAADLIGAKFVLVDPQRACVPVSGSAIRARPLAHWSYLPVCVRTYYVKKVRVLGAEGAGKTTLSRRLAEHFQTCCVVEAAALQPPRGKADVVRLGHAQLASERALERLANRVLICDTDLVCLGCWGERLFGAAPPWFWDEVRYDLTLLLRPRDDDPARAAFHERLRSRLTDYLELDASEWEKARAAVDELLG